MNPAASLFLVPMNVYLTQMYYSCKCSSGAPSPGPGRFS